MAMLAQMSWPQWFLAVLIIGICGFLILLILVQRGRGEGLTGAFGGGGGSGAFGAKTGDVFTWITVVVATLFLLLSVVGNFVFDESADRPGAPSVTAPTSQPTFPDSAPDSLPPAPLPGSEDVTEETPFP